MPPKEHIGRDHPSRSPQAEAKAADYSEPLALDLHEPRPSSAATAPSGGGHVYRRDLLGGSGDGLALNRIILTVLNRVFATLLQVIQVPCPLRQRV